MTGYKGEAQETRKERASEAWEGRVGSDPTDCVAVQWLCSHQTRPDPTRCLAHICDALAESPAIARAFSHNKVVKYIELIDLLKPTPVLTYLQRSHEISAPPLAPTLPQAKRVQSSSFVHPKLHLHTARLQSEDAKAATGKAAVKAAVKATRKRPRELPRSDRSARVAGDQKRVMFVHARLGVGSPDPAQHLKAESGRVESDPTPPWIRPSAEGSLLFRSGTVNNDGEGLLRENNDLSARLTVWLTNDKLLLLAVNRLANHYSIAHNVAHAQAPVHRFFGIKGTCGNLLERASAMPQIIDFLLRSMS
ncbi:hypothetical protein GGX14DRAFT_409247 [Mycena pura]|uniref:Uncharacterized protein n=1 Tax=Mycena pura TaxID=153505 RepID=A0AAD6UNQ5_9AGAR|nr:hypothetical protein GGX14DRAFT_409247 [Mycena pura]